ncbi:MULTISPECIES: hypothetical protein [unclassified Rhodanobacter]|uniref:hypothetical protein n=1 Tax=unclassified Rhodanobacter TaxID=2621553 RepID=UPI00098755A9|nr:MULTISPECIES: hypothetical protein [unclassified Rhodanobacter]OOG37791.1 hypothetical protein B0E51_15855 [Rhodanobacter sp. C05]OOG66257.1 hypothetical protein B0E46_01875 [Rhodanobacter sp. B04]
MTTDVGLPAPAGRVMSRQGHVPRSSSPWQRVLTQGSMFVGAAMLLLFLSVVIPNSLQIPTAVMLAICFLLCLPGFRMVRGLKTVFIFYTCSATVTVLFMAVGFLSAAPLMAAVQIPAIYLVSPFLWIVIAARLFNQLGEDRLVEWLVWLAILCCCSVAMYFYLYNTRGADAVSFFTESANVNTKDGYAGAVMHVYGSLIFLCGGFFSSPELIRNRLLRLVLLASLLVCAITSGRAALILSVPLGLLLGMVLTPRTIGSQGRRSVITQVMKYGLPVAFAVILVMLALSQFTKINLSLILGGVANKVASGGGDERVGQAHALYEGILNSGGMGVGHGIGVSFIRSSDYPWRYELVWLATVLRVGILGALVYAALFFVYIAKVLKIALQRRLTPGMKFMFCGFICAFIASSTNPYIEAFAFQWMYVLPVVGFFVEHSAARMSAPK